GYWFPDYLADLEVLLDRFAGGKPARIVGHSMGGNVAWLYAGTRPERVARVVSLDAFGLDETKPDEAAGRYARWLDQWRTPPAFSDYASLEDVAARVQKLAPRLDPGRAAFVAAEWSRRRPDGRFELRHDPGHKRVNPVLYRREEARACWRRIAAPCLLVLARESPFFRKYEEEGGREDCRSCIPALREAVVDAGHMLHLEQPGAVAELLDEFFRDCRPAPGRARAGRQPLPAAAAHIARRDAIIALLPWACSTNSSTPGPDAPASSANSAAPSSRRSCTRPSRSSARPSRTRAAIPPSGRNTCSSCPPIPAGRRPSRYATTWPASRAARASWSSARTSTTPAPTRPTTSWGRDCW